MSAFIRPDLLQVFAHINGAAGTVISGGLQSADVVRNSAGNYTITLPNTAGVSSGVDIDNCHPLVTVLGATPLISSVDQASDTVFEVLLESDLGVATDANFKFSVLKLRTE